MERSTPKSQPAPTTARPVGDAPAPALHYAPPPRANWLRRWLRPGSPAFLVLVIALASAGTWGAWKWRLSADEKAFNDRTTQGSTARSLTFSKPPNSASLRHLARVQGASSLEFNWTDEPNPPAPPSLRSRLPSVTEIQFFGHMDADPWVREIARPNTGLTALASLSLASARVTDASLKDLVRPDSGLKALTYLRLWNKQITDAGLKELSRPDSGLKSLARLEICFTSATDTGLRSLSRPDCGLKSLTVLNLTGMKMTDAGLKDLARPDCGLTALTDLDLEATGITDTGLKELARPDSGLKALANLVISRTRVTHVGIEALKKARPTLVIVDGPVTY